MTDIRRLLDRVAAAENDLRARRFIAPCVRGGNLRVNTNGLIYTFRPSPRDYAGWGVFQPRDEKTAERIEDAGLAQISQYLDLFPAVRLRLAYKLAGDTWLAYAANEADLCQRFSPSEARPVVVHLVAGGQEFEQIIAHALGDTFWFREVDRRASPFEAEQMRDARRSDVAPEDLAWKGLTPEMRNCYSLAVRRDHLERQREHERERRRRETTDERRLRGALRFGGGELRGHRDRGDYWTVEWVTRDGARHTSAVAKKDLTVISAGICLSGEDRKFDLQSLVGVVEGDWNY